MTGISFTTRLTDSDWDEGLRGWRCPPLAVPGAIVEAVYVEGERVDTNRYEVLAQHGVIRWSPPNRPERAVASIKLTEALTLGAETDRWKKLAIVLPVLATILSAAITGTVAYLRPSQSESSKLVVSTKQGGSNTSPSPAPPPSPGPNSAPSPVNASFRTAREFKLGESVDGNTADGERWFKFAVATTEPTQIKIVAQNQYRNNAAWLNTYNGRGVPITSNNLVDGDGLVLRFRSPQADMYYIAIRPMYAVVQYRITATEQ